MLARVPLGQAGSSTGHPLGGVLLKRPVAHVDKETMRTRREQLVFAAPALISWAGATCLGLGASWIAIQSLIDLSDASTVPSHWGLPAGWVGWLAVAFLFLTRETLVVSGLFVRVRGWLPIPLIALGWTLVHASQNAAILEQRVYAVHEVDGWDLDPVFLAYFLIPHLAIFLASLVVAPSLGVNAWRCLRNAPHAA